MKQNSIIRSLLALSVAGLVLCSFSACRQKSSSEGGKQLSAEDYARKMAKAAADSVGAPAEAEDSALFTYAMAMEIVQPR